MDRRHRWGPSLPPYPRQKLEPFAIVVDPEGTAWVIARQVGDSEPRCIDAADWAQFDLVGEEAA